MVKQVIHGRKLIVEIAPIEFHGYTKSQAAAFERELRDHIDTCARAVLNVGPRSKVVRSRLIDVA